MMRVSGILREGVQVIGEVDDRLVAAAHEITNAESGLLHHREGRRRDAAALADHGDGTGTQRVHLLQRGGEGRRDRRRRVDDADAIRAAEHEALLAAQRDERALQFGALAARFRQSAGIGDAMANAAVRAFADRRHERIRRNRENHEIGRLGQFGDACEARQPRDRRSRSTDRR